MKKPVIAVDIDEVLQPLHQPLLKHHNKRYATTFAYPDSQGRYFLEELTGESSKSVEGKLIKFIKSREFAEAEPLPGAAETVQLLKKRGYELIIVTSRQPFFKLDTQNFLKSHFPDLFAAVHFIPYAAGAAMSSAASKLTICQQIGARYIIDDNTKNAIACAEGGIEAILFGEYHWNKHENLPAGVTRCRDWRAVQEYFDALR